MRSKLVIVLVVCMIAGASYARANDSIADNAIECSAVFYIATAAPENASLSHPSMMMSHVYALHQRAHSGESVTNGDVLRARDVVSVRLADSYGADPNNVETTFLRCYKWGQRLSQYLSDAGLSEPESALSRDAIEMVFLEVPAPQAQTDYSRADLKLAKRVMLAAAREWSKDGIVTSRSVKEKLRKNLAE